MIGWVGIVAAGILNGTFAVPLKIMRDWKFNHVWGPFSILAMIVIPWAAVFSFVPTWKLTLSLIPHKSLVLLVALGLVWGVASLLYGLAISLLGIALGFSIQLGLSIVIGALIPFATVHGFALRTSADALFLTGVAGMVLGVIACARSGADAQSAGRTRRFRLGLLIAVLGGIGSPLLNIGIQYGISLLPSSAHRDPSLQWVPWAVFLSASALSQTGICSYRIWRAHQWALFCGPGKRHDAAFVVAMSIIWAVSIFLYGASADIIGNMGTSVGWPVFIGAIVLTSNAWGLGLGEWKGRPRRDVYTMLTGCAMLITAAFVIGHAKTGW